MAAAAAAALFGGVGANVAQVLAEASFSPAVEAAQVRMSDTHVCVMCDVSNHTDWRGVLVESTVGSLC